MRLIKLLAIIPALFISVNLFAQLAIFQDEEDVINPTFRYDVIKLNKIKSITIQYEYKPDGSPILSDGIIKYYRFDSLNRLVESYFTIKENHDKWDTIRSLYFYDDAGHLVIKRTNEGNFYDTWYYRWYKDGTMKKRAHVHEVPLNMNGNFDFRIGTQTILSADSFAYTAYPKQLQRFGFNEQNAIYEKTISYFDDKQRLTSRNFKYAVGWLYSQVDLKYDSISRVKEYGYTGNLNGDIHHTTKFVYDAYGNIATEKVYDGTKQTNNIEYIYDSTTGLITDQLDRDFNKAVINIARFSYEYR